VEGRFLSRFVVDRPQWFRLFHVITIRGLGLRVSPLPLSDGPTSCRALLMVLRSELVVPLLGPHRRSRSVAILASLIARSSSKSSRHARQAIT
jgi:hypothetical protein